MTEHIYPLPERPGFQDFFPPATIHLDHCVDCGMPIKMEGVMLGLMPFHTLTGSFLCPDPGQETDGTNIVPRARSMARARRIADRDAVSGGGAEDRGANLRPELRRPQTGNHGDT